MTRLSPSDAFTARELALKGFAPDRIAVLIDADADLVVAELAPRTVVEADAEPGPADSPEMVTKAAERSIDADAWPPPIDDATVWQSVRVSNGYGKPQTVVQVRPVRLWGRDVLIDRDNWVWCTYCGGRFHSVEQLGHPRNSCPTGIVRRREGVLFPVDADEMVNEARRAEVQRAIDWNQVPL